MCKCKETNKYLKIRKNDGILIIVINYIEGLRIERSESENTHMNENINIFFNQNHFLEILVSNENFSLFNISKKNIKNSKLNCK